MYVEEAKLRVGQDGTIEFTDLNFVSEYREGSFQKVQPLQSVHLPWLMDDLDFSESVPVYAWKHRVAYFHKGKGYYAVDWLVWDETVDNGFPYERYDTIDEQGRVWLYHPTRGLVMIDQGVVQRFERLPDYWTGMSIGGVLPLADGRVWIGSTGRIFEYGQGRWRQLVVTGTDQLFTHFVQDKQGVVYGATAEGLYEFTGDEFVEVKFVDQNEKPTIVLPPDQPEDCAAHKTYRVFSECGVYIMQRPHEDAYPDYTIRYLGVGDDGAVIYINNHLIAEWKDGKSRAFLFDVFDIAGAVIGPAEGYIWMFSKVDGIVRLDPDIFDEYQAGGGYFRSAPVDTPTMPPGEQD